MIKNYSNKRKNKNYKYRYLLFISILFALVSIVSWKLLGLHVTDRAFLQSQGESRAVRQISIPAYRGKILDRNGDHLAISTPVQSVWFEPDTINNKAKSRDLKKIESILGLDENYIKSKAQKYKNKEFVYLKRQISPEIEAKIANLKVPGINFQREFKRFYPHGEVSAHVVGFTDIEGNGLEGVELAYNRSLVGKDGKKRVVQDLYGREIEHLSAAQQAEDGTDIELSIDQRLQYLAHRALKNGIKKHNAKSGSAVIVDVKTGEVLAMANWPTYNPNQRHFNPNRDNIRNRAVTDFFEPASSIKAFSLASILEHTKVSMDTIVNTSPGIFKLTGGIVRDMQNYGSIDLLTIIKRSSNVGLAKLGQRLKSPEQLWDTYNKFGFGQPTEINFPGEASGLLSRENTEKPFVMATMMFGYGIAVTPLQLASAYTVFANHGIKLPISLLKLDKPKPGVQILSAKTARQIVDILTLSSRAQASNAKVTGYDVAGKTGTARILTAHGYVKDRHRAIYAGLAPAIDAKFAIAVTINEPSNGKYYGNQVAAPVFSKIATDALRLYKVRPDIMQTEGVYIAKSNNDKVIR